MKTVFFTFFTFFALFMPGFSQNHDITREKITTILSEVPASTEYSVIIYDPVTKDTVYSVYAEKTLIPASNTKLFSTATALYLMGGDYQVSTKFHITDKNINDGVINGNLYIKGYGNSLFTSSDLSKMVQELKEMGITRITGDIIGDDTYFDDIYSREDWIEEEGANVKVPPVSALVIDRNVTTATVRVKVKRRRWKNVTKTVHISDPSLYAAEMLLNKLRNAGITVGGSFGKGATPEQSEDIVASSVTLNEIISIVNKRSDNFLAECVFKLIGAVYSGEEGNSFYSTQAILTFMKENNVHFGQTSIVDGSGISRSDNVSAATIVSLLERMYFDISNFDDFKNSLSHASVDGTLRGRMYNSKAEGNFYGKTGTLNGVSTLAGYLMLPNKKDYVVSIMFHYEQFGAHFYKSIEDKIVEAVAEE